MTDWYWREPLWLLMALIPWALLLLDHWQRRQRQLAWADVALHDWALATNNTNPPWQRTRKHLRNGLLWLTIAIALAGPRSPQDIPKDWQASNAPLMLVLDVSQSMLADDIPPTRKRYALKVLKTWRKQHPQLRAGLVLYAGQAHTLIPPTQDLSAWQDALNALPNLQMPSHGSNLAAAIVRAHQNLKHARTPSANTTTNPTTDTTPNTENGETNGGIVILTDADFSNAQQQQNLKAIRSIRAADPSLQIAILGIGGRAAIPLSNGDGGWLSEAGNPVLTRLHSETIKALSNAANGLNLIADPNQRPKLEDLWQAPGTRLNAQQQQHIQWQEHYPVFVIIALLLIVGPIVGPIVVSGWSFTRIATHNSRPTNPNTPSILLVLSILAISGSPHPLHASPPNTNAPQLTEAWNAWQTGEYRRAARLYAAQNGWTARMGEGSSCYRIRDYACAIQAYSRAARIANNDQQRSDAAYNLGNSYFHDGDFTAATALYQDVLRYRPNHHNASNNLEFSTAMQAAVARWQRQQLSAERAGRAGRGWRQRDVDPNQVIPPSANLSLGDKKGDKQADNTGQTQQGNEAFKQLLQAGIKHAQLVNTGKTPTRQTGRFIETDNPATNQDGNNANRQLWQRLFEMEEGYPAPLEHPKRLKERRPW